MSVNVWFTDALNLDIWQIGASPCDILPNALECRGQAQDLIGNRGRTVAATIVVLFFSFYD